MLPSATFVPPGAVPGVLLWGSSVGSESRISKSKRPSGMSDVAERVKKIVVEHLNVDQEKVTDNASFIEDLGADSLDTVELVMAFEEEFGIDIPDEDAEQMRTVGDAVSYMKKHSSGSAG